MKKTFAAIIIALSYLAVLTQVKLLADDDLGLLIPNTSNRTKGIVSIFAEPVFIQYPNPAPTMCVGTSVRLHQESSAGFYIYDTILPANRSWFAQVEPAGSFSGFLSGMVVLTLEGFTCSGDPFTVTTSRKVIFFTEDTSVDSDSATIFQSIYNWRLNETFGNMVGEHYTTTDWPNNFYFFGDDPAVLSFTSLFGF